MNSPPAPIAYAQALETLRRVAAECRLGSERISIRRADNRILAEDVVARVPFPAFDNSRMDGFALRHADLNSGADTSLALAGEQLAGLAPEFNALPGQCIRITTGAPIPTGMDTVVIKEDVQESDGRVVLSAVLRCGANIRRFGDDVQSGDVVLQAGQVLTPARTSLAAALGEADLLVSVRPTVAVFTTGDELQEPGLPLSMGQVYNSNRELLMGLLRAEGLEPVAWPTLPDDPARIESALRDAATAFDVVMTCGAVSVGEKDCLPRLMRTHGRIDFWRVRMKPGMPLLFGKLERALVLGLPGNPVSVLATFLALGREVLDGLQGRTDPRPRRTALLAAPWSKSHGRHEFLRGRLQHGDDAVLRVMPQTADASHRLRAAADSDALIVLPEGEREYAEGDALEVIGY